MTIKPHTMLRKISFLRWKIRQRPSRRLSKDCRMKMIGINSLIRWTWSEGLLKIMKRRFRCFMIICRPSCPRCWNLLSLLGQLYRKMPWSRSLNYVKLSKKPWIPSWKLSLSNSSKNLKMPILLLLRRSESAWHPFAYIAHQPKSSQSSSWTAKLKRFQ